MENYMKAKGRIFDIQKYSIHDGPGIRTIIFLKGCALRCRWCCNPESQEFDIQTMMFEGKEKVMGYDVTVEDVMPAILQDTFYYNRSGGGVTLSGGEPFSQPEEHAQLAQLLHQNGYEVAAYTGYTFEQLLEGTPQQRHLLENIDVLVDGPFLLEKKTLELRFRGSSNQRVLNVPESLAQGKAVWESRESWVGERRF